MLFSILAETSDQLRKTRSRLAKTALLSQCISDAEFASRPVVCAYLAGDVRQSKLGVGYAALNAVRDTEPAPKSSTTVASIDADLATLAAISGTGSKQRREEHLRAMLRSLTAREQAFLSDLVLGELRQGALTSLVLEAIASAAGAAVADVRRAYMLEPDLGRICDAAFDGTAALAAFKLEVFQPVQPMLAQTAQSITDALQRMASARFELKLDGARIQVHKDGTQVRVYTRNLNEVTHAVPEVLEVAANLEAERLVLDGEVIALREDGTPLPFQVTMRRFGRKADVEKTRAQIPLSIRFFDCLLRDHTQVFDLPLRQRAAILEQTVGASLMAPSLTTANADEAGAFLTRALAEGHEGVMVKHLELPYEAGARGAGWLKLKHAHTLDLVVLAAEWGSGRRRGKLSNLHLGAYDAERGDFVMLGKTFKGLTDRLLVWQTEALLARETHRDDYTVHVRPELVVEVAFNDVQQSSQYPAGMALRFARVKQYRDDKPATQADTLQTVRTIFAAAIAGTGAPSTG
ncbi:MAG: ATP-dependent DNA ligase [Pseudomonadota bacterium]